MYPLSALSKLEALSQEVLSTLKHLKNLRSLVWTRKGSLSAEMFEAICQLDKLERLELNATPAGGWRADQVVRLPLSLQSLTLLLPDREVVAYHLPRWLAKRHERKQAIADDRSSSHVDAPLRQLSIICMESPIVNTTTLAEIGRPGLAGLTSFTLHGCIRLSDVDVLDFLKRTPQLRHLALEAVSISPGFYSEAAPYLSRLESLRTSHPGRKSQATDAYYAGLLALVTAAQGTLRSFTHYLSGDTERGRHPEVPHAFLAHLVQSCKETLVKLEISGLSMQPISVRDICLTAKKLEHLVLPVDMRDLVRGLPLFMLHTNRILTLPPGRVSILPAGTDGAPVPAPRRSVHTGDVLPPPGDAWHRKALLFNAAANRGAEPRPLDRKAGVQAGQEHGVLRSRRDGERSDSAVVPQKWDESLPRPVERAPGCVSCPERMRHELIAFTMCVGIWPEALLVVRT